MRDLVTTACELAGFAAIAAGALMVSVPLGLAVAGGSLILIGWLGGRQ